MIAASLESYWLLEWSFVEGIHRVEMRRFRIGRHAGWPEGSNYKWYARR